MGIILDIDQLLAAYIPQPTVKLTTSDLFDINKHVFTKIINHIGLTVTTDSATMKVNQQQCDSTTTLSQFATSM